MNSNTWSYTFTVNLTNGSPGFVEFRARMLAGAHSLLSTSLRISGNPSLGVLQIARPNPKPGEPDLAIVKTGPTNTNPGDVISYSISYYNALWGDTATGVQISDRLPDGVSFVSCDSGGAPLGNTITWDLGNLSRGASGVVTYQVAVTNTVTTGYSLQNLASIASAEIDSYPLNNLWSVTTTVSSNCAPPSLVAAPSDASACPGSSATLSVVVDGSAPMHYQWMKDGVLVAGATNDTLELDSVASSDSGGYSVLVSNLCGVASYGPVQFTVGGPMILNQPAGASVCVSNSAVFLVNPTGQSLTYQWRKDSVEIPGATNSLLVISSVSTQDAGGYDVWIASACGSTTSSVATLTVNVPATIMSDPTSVTACEGDPVNLAVTANAGSPITYQWRKDAVDINGATNNSYAIAAAGAADSGDYDVLVAACNPPLTSAVATVTINSTTVITQNPSNVTICAGSPVALSVSANGSALWYQWRKGGSGISGATNSTFTIASASATDSGSYDVVVSGACGPAMTSTTVTVTVKSPPLAADDSYSTNEGTPLNVAAPGVLGNDTEAGGDPMTAILVTGPANGSVTLYGNGSFSYTPNALFYGSDSFTYFAQNSCGVSGTATVTLAVAHVNHPPTANGDAYTTAENATLNVTAPGVLGNDSDPDGDPLTAVLASGPAHGSLTLNADGSFAYTPSTHFYGSDSFTYEASDGTAQSAPATVNITVTHVNQPPTAAGDSYNTAENTALNVAAPGVLGNDSDPDGDPLTAVLASSPAHGSLTLNADGSFVYTPSTYFYGSDSFTYEASDGTAQSAPATVNITVNHVNQAPVAVDDSYNATEDTVLTVAAPGVLGNDSDPDGDSMTATLIDGPSHGVASLNPDGSFTYTPSTNFFGSDAFTYQASDGTLQSSNATVTIHVAHVNHPPVAVDDSLTIAENSGPHPIDVLANDSDPDGDPLTISQVTQPLNGSVTIAAGATGVTYTATSNFYGTNSFTYTIIDGQGGAATATVTVAVLHVAVAPVAQDDSYQVLENDILQVPGSGVLANDTNVEAAVLTAVLVSEPAHGSLTFHADGSFTYTPDSNYIGPDSFTYKANNGFYDSNVATVHISVLAVNGASDADLYVKTAAAKINWAKDSRDALTIRGQINPRGMNDDLTGATLAVEINGVSLAPPQTLNARGMGKSVAGSAKASSRLKNKNGAYSFRITGTDLREALGLTNRSEAGVTVLNVTLTINGANLDVPVTTAQLECPYRTTTNKTSLLKFNFRKNRTLSGAFNCNRTVGSLSIKSETAVIRGAMTAEGGGPIVPNGDITVQVGNAVLTLPFASLTAKATGTNSVWQYAGHHGEPGITKFTLSNATRSFTVSISANDLGLPAAGPAGPMKYDLPLLIEVPTADGPMYFDSIIELERSSGTSKHWQR